MLSEATVVISQLFLVLGICPTPASAEVIVQPEAVSDRRRMVFNMMDGWMDGRQLKLLYIFRRIQRGKYSGGIYYIAQWCAGGHTITLLSRSLSRH